MQRLIDTGNATVEYTNLIPGKKYTMEGMPVIVNGVAIVKEVTFTPASPNGEISVTFPAFNPYYAFADTDKRKEYKYVVFEEVYLNRQDENGRTVQSLIGEHKDLKDQKQTVSNYVIQTGDETLLIIFIGLAVFALAGIVFVIWKKRKLSKEK